MLVYFEPLFPNDDVLQKVPKDFFVTENNLGKPIYDADLKIHKYIDFSETIFV